MKRNLKKTKLTINSINAMNLTLRSFFKSIVQFKAELEKSHKSINPKQKNLTFSSINSNSKMKQQNQQNPKIISATITTTKLK